MLSSENLGDRLRAVNQIRELEPAIAFELVQTAINDRNARVRYSAVSQMDTRRTGFINRFDRVARSSLTTQPDVQAAAADCLRSEIN